MRNSVYHFQITTPQAMARFELDVLAENLKEILVCAEVVHNLRKIQKWITLLGVCLYKYTNKCIKFHCRCSTNTTKHTTRHTHTHTRLSGCMVSDCIPPKLFRGAHSHTAPSQPGNIDQSCLDKWTYRYMLIVLLPSINSNLATGRVAPKGTEC